VQRGGGWEPAGKTPKGKNHSTRNRPRTTLIRGQGRNRTDWERIKDERIEQDLRPKNSIEQQSTKQRSSEISAIGGPFKGRREWEGKKIEAKYQLLRNFFEPMLDQKGEKGGETMQWGVAELPS